MKRDFLQNLGIEDKDIIDKILDENSTDIGKAKGELETYKNKVADLEKDLKTKDNTIKDLEGKVGDSESLNKKIKDLELDKTNLQNELNTKVSTLEKNHAVESAIREAKGKNVKAIMALLDNDKITYENGELSGISDQLEALAKAEDSSMLFGDTQTPAGTHLGNPKGGNGAAPTSATLAEAVAKALGQK